MQIRFKLSGRDVSLREGFTIVELLIVIVVIGILASISVVAYSGISNRALNSVRAAEVQAWSKLFALYKSQNGSYPAVPGDYGDFCLGSGFPVGGNGEARCREFNRTDHMSYRESDSQALMDEIKTVGALPSANPRSVRGWIVGPYINYWTTGYTITHVFDGGQDDCPSSMKYAWDDGAGTLLCYVEVFD